MSPTTRSSKRATSHPSTPDPHSNVPTSKKRRHSDKGLKPSDKSNTKDQPNPQHSENEPSPDLPPKTESDNLKIKEEAKEDHGVASPVEVDRSFVVDKHENTIEKGHVYFFYRSKINIDKPKGINDVQKLYLLLSPDTTVGKFSQNDQDQVGDFEGKASHRLLIIPKKILPVYGGGAKSRSWAFVDQVSPDLKKVKSRLEKYTYSTKTLGERTQESARLIGEARYEIFLDQQNHGHLIYELVVPQEPTAVQNEFNIAKDGHFILQVKNPDIKTTASSTTDNTNNDSQEPDSSSKDKAKEPKSSGRFTGLGKNPVKLPQHLQDKFHGKRKDWVRFASLDSAEFLDFRYVEILLIAANRDTKEEFAEFTEELENDVKEEEEEYEGALSDPEDAIYQELNFDEKTIPNATNEFI